MKTIASVCLLLLVSTIVIAEPISIDTRTEFPISTDPRQNISIVFLLNNDTEDAVHAGTSLELPPGWSTITPPPTVVVPAEGSAVAILSFFVPQEAEPGLHDLTFAATDPEGASGSFVFEVLVLPSISIEVDLREAPPYVIAGEEPEIVFEIRNTSNTTITADIDLRSGLGFPAAILGQETKSIPLAVKESKKVAILVKTRGTGGKIARYRLDLLATPRLDSQFVASEEGSAIVTAGDSCEFEVIPLVSNEQLDYHTFPLRVSAGHGERIGIDWTGDVTIKASGSGFLDQDNNHKLDILLLSTLTLPDFGVFGSQDRYRLNYSWGPLEVDLGDNNYRVSPLFGNALFGRGVASRYIGDTLSFGGFYYFEHLRVPVAHHAGLTSQFSVPDSGFQDGFRYRANALVLSTLPQDLSLSLYQEYRPIEEINLILDVAAATHFTNDLTWAILFRGDARFPFVDVNASAHFGRPDFTGTIKDTYRISAHFAARVIAGILDAKSGYTQEQKNVDLDVSQSSAPLARDFYIGSGLRIPGIGTNAYLQWNIKTRKDLLQNTAFDDLTHVIAVRVTQPIQSVSLRIRAAWEILNNRIDALQTLQQQYSATLDFSPTPSSSYNLYLNANAFSGGTYDSTLKATLGVNTSHRFGPLSLKLDTAGSLYFGEEAFEGVGLYASGNINFRINDRHEIMSNLRLTLPPSSSGSSPDFRFGINYKTNFDIPLSPKRDVGALEGAIYEGTTGHPLSSVIVRIADRAVITDENGYYRISSLPRGEYFLDIDSSRVSMGMIPDRKLPIKVEIEPGETERINFNVVRGSTIEGQVSLYAVLEQRQGLLQISGDDDSPEYDEKDLVLDSGFPNVLMEIRNNGETRRVLTDRNGRFSFTDILPGTWTLRVAEASLPKYHEFVEGEFIVEVGPGEIEERAIKIFPIKRPVTMLLQGGALSLTIKKSEQEPQPVALELTSARAAVTDFEAIARETRKAGLPGNANKPRLLGLDWGMSPGEAGEYLASTGGGFGELTHVSAGDATIRSLGGAGEERDIQSAATTRYYTEGIALRDLQGVVILSFLNPKRDKSEMLLSGIELRMRGRDADGEIVNLEEVYRELALLFWSKWRVPVIGVEKQAFFDTGRYIHTVNDVEVAYELRREENELVVTYSSDWFMRILRRARGS